MAIFGFNCILIFKRNQKVWTWIIFEWVISMASWSMPNLYFQELGVLWTVLRLSDNRCLVSGLKNNSRPFVVVSSHYSKFWLMIHESWSTKQIRWNVQYNVFIVNLLQQIIVPGRCWIFPENRFRIKCFRISSFL